MFELGTEWWQILLRTTVVYGAVLIGLRLSGKRQIGQMAPFDLVVIILIANAVQNAMVGPDTSLAGGLISAGTLLVLNFGVSRLSERLPWVGRVVEGQATVLISHGQVLPDRLRGEGVDAAELEEAIREHGLAGIEQVELAVLEVDGAISIVPKDAAIIRTRRKPRRSVHHP